MDTTELDVDRELAPLEASFSRLSARGYTGLADEAWDFLGGARPAMRQAEQALGNPTVDRVAKWTRENVTSRAAHFAGWGEIELLSIGEVMYSIALGVLTRDVFPGQVTDLLTEPWRSVIADEVPGMDADR